MIMTIDSMAKSVLDQISTNEHRLEPIVVSKLKLLVKEASSTEDSNILMQLNNTLVNLDLIMQKANNLYLHGKVDI